MLHTSLGYKIVGFGTNLNLFLIDKQKSTYHNIPAGKRMLERSSKTHS